MEKIPLKELAEHLSLDRLFWATFVALLAWLLIRALRLLLENLAERFYRHRLQITSAYPILRLLLWVSAIGFIIFKILSPPGNVVLAVTASAGITLGLAAQDVLKNLIGGILIMFARPFRVGDMVQFGAHYGEVISMDLNVVRFRTFNDNVVTIPNGEFFKQPVSNANTGQLTEMVVVEFDLPATIDVQKVKHLAREAAESSPYTYLKKPVSVLVEDRFERTFLSRFKVKAYVLDVRFERLMASDIMERIKKEIVAQGLLTDELVMGLLAVGA